METYGQLWTMKGMKSVFKPLQMFVKIFHCYLRLEHEENISKRNGKSSNGVPQVLRLLVCLPWVIQTQDFQPVSKIVFGPVCFLFGTAAILYTTRDTPFVYMTDTQSDLANYHSRESVERILLKTFGLPPTEETEESNTTKKPDNRR